MTQRDSFEARLKYLRKTAGKRPKLAPLGAEGKDGYPAPKRSRFRRIMTPVLNVVLAVTLMGGVAFAFEERINSLLPQDVTLSGMVGLNRADIADLARTVTDAFWAQDVSVLQSETHQNPRSAPAPDTIKD